MDLHHILQAKRRDDISLVQFAAIHSANGAGKFSSVKVIKFAQDRLFKE